MNDAGVVTMLAFSVAAGCTEPNFIIRPNFTGRTTEFRDDAIRRPPFYQFDINFAKMTQLNDKLKLQIRFELYNVLNQVDLRRAAIRQQSDRSARSGPSTGRTPGSRTSRGTGSWGSS